MKKHILLGLLCAVLAGSLWTAQAADTRFYEMRTYYAAPGKGEALHARFRDHTVKLFEKHGMQNIGYWAALDKDGNKLDTLIYLLAYPSREAREASWKAFVADPDWQKAHKASEANGKLVEKAESVFLKTTDYSPEMAVAKKDPARVFELRVYKCNPGRLPNLDARFRDHTIKLFGKYGMENLGYFHPADEKDGASDTLIYFLAHKSRESAAASFRAFGQDPEWQAARKASEEKAGGSLTAPGGVKSTFMVPTDYSATR